jgi:hypothetical protein
LLSHSPYDQNAGLATTTTTTTTTMNTISTVIPLSISNERQQQALLGQLDHHRQRRLAFVDERRRLLAGDDGEVLKYSPSTWRQQGNLPRNLQSITMTTMELTNCHLVLYSGYIGLGSTPQKFRIDLDTASSDIWVPSVKCDETCDSYKFHNKYNESLSDTYKVATQNAQHNEFHVEYEDGELVSQLLYYCSFYCFVYSLSLSLSLIG